MRTSTRAKHSFLFLQQQTLGRRLGQKSPPPLTDVPSKVVVLLLLNLCFLLLPLFVGVQCLVSVVLSVLSYFVTIMLRKTESLLLLYSKTCVKRPLKKRQNKEISMTNDILMLPQGCHSISISKFPDFFTDFSLTFNRFPNPFGRPILAIFIHRLFEDLAKIFELADLIFKEKS